MSKRKYYIAIFEDFVKGDIILEKTDTREQAEKAIENHRSKSNMLMGFNSLSALSYSNKYRIDEVEKGAS